MSQPREDPDQRIVGLWFIASAKRTQPKHVILLIERQGSIVRLDPLESRKSRTCGTFIRLNGPARLKYSLLHQQSIRYSLTKKKNKKFLLDIQFVTTILLPTKGTFTCLKLNAWSNGLQLKIMKELSSKRHITW